MARKIVIRRVGGLLPAVSLVVLMLLIAVVGWLSLAGLPASALRYVEQEAARHGIYLKIGKIKLSPSSGLALRARNIQLYAAQGDEAPLATMEQATFAISATALLRGKLQPTKAEVLGADVSIPTDTDASLILTDINISTTIRNGRMVQFTSASARLEGIPITLSGRVALPDTQEQQKENKAQPEEQATPLNLAALLHTWRHEAARIHRIIASQQWSPNELPSIELRLLATGRTHLGARINVPRLDRGQFHFRDATLDAAYVNQTILINKAYFSTIEPDSEVMFQGGYDIQERHLSLNLESTAAVTRMAEAFAIPGVDMQNIRSWLRRFRHPDHNPPLIEIHGDMFFEKNFTPKSLSLAVEISQKDFIFGQTEIEELNLDFYYRDGSFNINRLHLGFPSEAGSLTFSASASPDTHTGKASIKGDADVSTLLGLANEFTSKPLVLPEGLELKGNLEFMANAVLDMPSFVAGSTDLGHYLPALHRMSVGLSIRKASHHGCTLERPRIELSFDHVHDDESITELLPHRLKQAKVALSAKNIDLPRKEGQQSNISLKKAEMELDMNSVIFKKESEGAPYTPSIDSATGKLRIATLSMPSFKAKAVEMELTQANHIRPMAEDWRKMILQGALRLSTGALQSGATLIGALDSKLQLDAEGNIDLKAVLEREGNRMQLELTPQLTRDGLLVLDQVQLELPAAGFAPLLDIAGFAVTQVRLPDTLTLTGSATYDTRHSYLRQAEGELSIPHFVRTPGDSVEAFQGEEVPLSLHVNGQATGRKEGGISYSGKLALTQKLEDNERELKLNFTGNTEGHVHMEGTNTIDVNTVDKLIDIPKVHHFMRDFSTRQNSTTQVSINALDINYADGLTVTANCDVHATNLGYQMFAYVDEVDREGTPTGRESLRKDFGRDPFRRVEQATAHVDVHYKADAQGKLETMRISILNPDLTYDNKPWLRSQGFTNGVSRSRMQGDAVIIDVAERFVELRNLHGSCYPAYAIGAYYDRLPVFLKDVVLERPARMETKHCLFPFSRSCPHDMSGCIRMEADRAGLRFAGTTIPLTRFTGFIWFKKGAVSLDRLNAACWDGAVNAALTIDYSGKTTSLDGFATLSNLNLKHMAAAYGSKQEPALCNCTFRFRSPSTELRALQGYGELHIVDGELMHLRIFRPVGELITNLPGNLAELERKALSIQGNDPSWINRKISGIFKNTGKTLGQVGEQVSKFTNALPFANHFLRYDLQEVHSGFTIDDGILSTEGMTAIGHNLSVGLRLNIDLEKQTLNGDLWPKISSVPTIILAPITFLSDFMIDIDVYGKMNDIQWTFGLNKLHKKRGRRERCVTDEAPEQPMSPKEKKANR